MLHSKNLHFVPFSIILPLLHAHSFIYRPRHLNLSIDTDVK